MADAADYRQMARAQLAADEYRRASDSLAALRAELSDEERALRRMKGLAVPVGVGIGALLAATLVRGLPELYGEYGLATSVVGMLLIVPMLAAMCAWFACAPAGVIGMWRSLGRSGWFVWGGGAIMAVILVLFIAVPCLLGPFYLWSQSRRVKRLKGEVAEAEGRFAEASAAIR